MSSHLIPFHLIPSHSVSSHLISSRPIPSHVISCTRARGSESRLHARAQGAAPYLNQQAQLVASSGTRRRQPARNSRPSARPGGAKGGRGQCAFQYACDIGTTAAEKLPCDGGRGPTRKREAPGEKGNRQAQAREQNARQQARGRGARAGGTGPTTPPSLYVVFSGCVLI